MFGPCLVFCFSPLCLSPFFSALPVSPPYISLQPLEILCRPLPVPSLSAPLSGRIPGAFMLALSSWLCRWAPPEAQLLPACVFAGLCHQRGLRKLFLWNGCLWTCWSRMSLTQNGDDRMVVPVHPHTGEIKPTKFVHTDICMPSGVPSKGILIDPLGRARTGWQRAT